MVVLVSAALGLPYLALADLSPGPNGGPQYHLSKYLNVINQANELFNKIRFMLLTSL